MVSTLDRFEDIGHTETARRQLEEMLIGPLQGTMVSVSVSACGSTLPPRP